MGLLKYVFQFFLFLLALTLEVRVKADINQWPADCNSGALCGFEATGVLERKDFDSTTVLFSESSVLVTRDPGHLSFVKGVFWLNVKKKLKFESTLARGVLAPGIYKFRVTKERINYSVAQGDMVIWGKGHEKPLRVRSGFSNHVSQVDKSGKAVFGVLEPAPWSELRLLVAMFHKSDKMSFREEIAKIYELWKVAVELSSKVQKEVADYELHKHYKAEQAALQKKKAWKRERVWLKNQYWNKVFEQ